MLGVNVVEKIDVFGRCSLEDKERKEVVFGSFVRLSGGWIC